MILLRLFRPLIRTILFLAFLSVGFGPSSQVYALAPFPLPRDHAISETTVPAFSCDRPVRVMPLGDSITRGSSSGTPVDLQYYISYRRDLYKGLVARGFPVDFVGSRKSDGSYYTDFDRDHEGWGGKKDEYIAQNVYTWLTTNPADIILLHIGTNDMSPTVPDTSAADVEQILNEIDRFDPGTWVIIARIIQRVPYDPDTEIYNNNVDQMLAARLQAGDKILKVDMENGAGIAYALYPAGDMNNELHPYATGYAKMATVWEQSLLALLPSCACVISKSGDPSNSPGQPGACKSVVFMPVVNFTVFQ